MTNRQTNSKLSAPLPISTGKIIIIVLSSCHYKILSGSLDERGGEQCKVAADSQTRSTLAALSVG